MEWGPRSSGVGFFCFHALGDTKQKKPTPLDRGPPLHVNRVLVIRCDLNFINYRPPATDKSGKDRAQKTAASKETRENELFPIFLGFSLR